MGITVGAGACQRTDVPRGEEKATGASAAAAHTVPVGDLTGSAAVGEYEIRTWRPDVGEGRVEILRDGQRIYERTGHVFEIGGSRYGPTLIEAGTDVTADGIPDAIVLEWTGGAHCCFDVEVFQLGPVFRVLARVEGQHTKPEFKDVDADGLPEVLLNDWTFAYWPGCFADSPAPAVILHWTGARYEVARDLMCAPAPPAHELAREAEAVRSAARWAENQGRYSQWYIPATLFQRALDLMYSGNEDAGWAFIRQAWSPLFPVDEELLAEFRQRRNGSAYWRALQGAEDP